MLARIWRNWNSHTLLGGKQNDAAALENSLVVSQKVKHKITIWLSNSTPRYVSKRTENRYLNICTWMFIVVLFITANRCQNRLIGKQNVTYTLNGILFSHKKEWSIDTWYMNELQKYAKWKKSGTEDYMFMIPFIYNAHN